MSSFIQFSVSSPTGSWFTRQTCRRSRHGKLYQTFSPSIHSIIVARRCIIHAMISLRRYRLTDRMWMSENHRPINLIFINLYTECEKGKTRKSCELCRHTHEEKSMNFRFYWFYNFPHSFFDSCHTSHSTFIMWLSLETVSCQSSTCRSTWWYRKSIRLLELDVFQ